MSTQAPPVGLSGRVALTVSDADTAIAMGSGDVAVFATPRAVALVEQAACAALAGHIAADDTTVGVTVTLNHRKPTQVGGQVTAVAVLEAVDGRKLDFAVSVKEGDDTVASGTHRRVIAPRTAFLP